MTEYRSDSLERTLRNLQTSIDGVRECVVVNVDGLLVASFPPGDDENPHLNPTSSPQVAALASMVIGLAGKTFGRLAQGKLERLLLEGEEGIMVVYPAGRASLVVLVYKDAYLAPVLIALKHAAVEVADILGN
jgi:uncharacterized protein